MAIPTFPPSKDADLLTWSSNFDQKITAQPTRYGLDAAQATAYTTLHTAYESAYNTAVNPTTNSHSNIIAKNDAREQLVNSPGGAWELVRIAQASPGMTDTLRGELAIRIPDTEPTPIPAPDTAPDLSIVSTLGRTIKVRLRDQENPDRRGKPNGVAGATVVYFVGDEAPTDPTEWIFSSNVSKTVFDVAIRSNVAAGSKVWISAFWFNARMQSGPAAIPESTRISDGLSQAA